MFAIVLGGCAVACELAADLGPKRTLLTPEGPDGATVVDDAGWTGVGPTDAGEDPTAITPPDAADAVGTGPLSVTALALAVGPRHACAIIQLGPGDMQKQVWCWGSNGSGELGAPPRYSSTPVRVDIPVGVGVQALSLAAGYSFAVTDDMSPYLYAWGAVPSDPLGVQREPSDAPYEPSLMDFSVGRPIAGVASVSIGAEGGCFTQSNQTQCWGPYASGSFGAAGNVAEGGSVVSAQFDSVAVGQAHACGVAMHDVECWGANDHGQAGVVDGGARVSDPTPLGLTAGGGMVQKVAVGRDTSCALLDNGSVYCWGANERGQAGAVDAGRDIRTPTLIALPLAAIDIAVGDSHACALLISTGNVWCWGDDRFAQLGNGPMLTPQKPSAVHVPPPQPPQSQSQSMRLIANLAMTPGGGIAAGGSTTCARDETLQVRCWGANEFGQAGRLAPDGGTQCGGTPCVPYATPVAF